MTLAAEVLKPTNLQRFRDVQLRPADAEECLAGGYTPFQAISHGVENSWESFAVYAGPDLLAVWGYWQTGFLGAGCNLWLLSTPVVDRVPLTFARESWRIVHTHLGGFSTLICYVHAEHEQALHWLKWLGFSLHSVDSDFYIMILRRT